MAIDRYQDQVDAIIHVASTTDSSGGFEVSGEAVEIKGPCSFCRHKELVEVANDEANRSIAAPGGDVMSINPVQSTRSESGGEHGHRRRND